MRKRLTDGVVGVGVAALAVWLLVLALPRVSAGQDTTSMLSVFLTNLRNGSLGFPLGTNAYGYITAQSDGVWTLFNNAKTDYGRLQFGGTSASFPALARSGTKLIQQLADGSAGGSLQSSGAVITVSSGTGLTVNDSGALVQHVYKISVAKEALACNATSCDVTLATLPAQTFVSHVLADVTAAGVCSAVCTTATLSFVVGKTAGGNEYLAVTDFDAGTGQRGDAAAELGASLTEASIPTAIGDLASWSATTAVVARFTSGTGAWGNGTVTNLSAGAVTFYLTTVRYP